jgi:hypothetical protein
MVQLCCRSKKAAFPNLGYVHPQGFEYVRNHKGGVRPILISLRFLVRFLMKIPFKLFRGWDFFFSSLGYASRKRLGTAGVEQAKKNNCIKSSLRKFYRVFFNNFQQRTKKSFYCRNETYQRNLLSQRRFAL